MRSSSNLMDRLGIWASSLCALHCLMLPVLLTVAPVIGASFFAQHWFENIILSLSILLGFWGLMIGFKRYHRQLYPIYTLIMGAIVYWNKDAFGEQYEPVTIAIGATLIIVAHIINIRLCNACRECGDCASTA